MSQANEPGEFSPDELAEFVSAHLQNGASRDIENSRPRYVWNHYESHYLEDNKSENGLQSIESAWNLFTEWMEDEGHRYLTDLSPRFPGRHDDWVVNHDEYDKKPISRSMHLTRIKQVIDHAKSRGWISPNDVPDTEVWEEIKPDVGVNEKIRSDPPPTERGQRIMQWVRNEMFGSRSHVLWIPCLELWFTGISDSGLEYGPPDLGGAG